jgi:uncharacterized protein (UPF0333 family)
MKKRGQAAMEFLMTYGWAIMIILVVVAALYYLGLFDAESPSTISVDANAGIMAQSVVVDETGVLMKLSTTPGTIASISNLQINGGPCDQYSPSLGTTLTSGKDIYVKCVKSGLKKGDKVSVNIDATVQSQSGLSHAIKGSASGEVETANYENILKDPSVVSLYRFEGNAQDSSGNGNDGISKGPTGPTYITSKTGYGLAANFLTSVVTTPNYLEIADNDLLKFNQTESFSIIYWIKATTPISPNNPRIYRKGANYYAFTNAGETTLRSYSYSTTPTSCCSVLSTTTLDNQWHSIIFTLDRTGVGKMRIYKDGVLMGNLDTLNGLPNVESTESLKIGYGTGSNEHLNGAIDDFAIFNRVLTQAEITALANP